MKRALLATLIGCLLATTASAEIEGAWTASVDSKTDRIFLSLTRGRNNQNGNTYRLADLSGLTAAQIDAATRTDVHFEIRREPGTIAFDGSFKSGRGAGQFAFTPNRAFVAELRKMNFRLEDLEDDDDSEEEQLYFLATVGFSTEYVRSMQAEGFRGDFKEFVEMRLFGVTKEYIAEMRNAGFKDLSREKLVEARIHGVTPEYIREARAFGWNLSLDKLIETRIHGATPKFAQEMAKVGYPNLSQEKLVEMRIFGVTAKFVRELAAAGYEKVPVDKLIEMKMHGIDADFIKRMEKAKP